MGEIVGTIKASGDPWIVIHAENAGEYVALLHDAIQNGVFEATGRGVEAIRTKTLLGSELGATPLSTEQHPQPQYQAPPPAFAPQDAQPAQWGQPAPQQQGYGQQYAPPQQPQVSIPQLPPGEPDVKPCPHGGKVWKAGLNKQNKPYGGWFCGGPRGGQCAAEFPRR